MNAIPKTEWDMAYSVLPESKKRLLLELANNLMPTESPEPGDTEAHEEALAEYRRGECVRHEDIDWS
ncbi:MAG: hypothetical protein LBE16_00915 [Clostridiales Family XIII bacterium]|jgi:hypothetical protein|nr:hypothetical protein [Clostridiales Family XIII bacterium]